MKKARKQSPFYQSRVPGLLVLVAIGWNAVMENDYDYEKRRLLGCARNIFN